MINDGVSFLNKEIYSFDGTEIECFRVIEVDVSNKTFLIEDSIGELSSLLWVDGYATNLSALLALESKLSKDCNTVSSKISAINKN